MMATVQVAEDVETGADAPTSVVKVWIAKMAAELDVDISKFPAPVWAEVVHNGIKSMLERGLTGPKGVTVKGLEDGSEELTEARERASEIVYTNLEKMYSGEIRLSSVKKVKEKKGKVKTRAMQKARVYIKAQIRAENQKISGYTARQISELAEQLLEEQPEIIDEAREELASEEKAAEKLKNRLEKSQIKLTSKIKPDPKRIKRAEELALKAKVAAKKRREAQAEA